MDLTTTLASFGVRDLAWLGTLLVSVSLAYGRLRSEIRHLDDTKAERDELVQLNEELRSQLGEIQTSLARLETALVNLNPTLQFELKRQHRRI